MHYTLKIRIKFTKHNCVNKKWKKLSLIFGLHNKSCLNTIRIKKTSKIKILNQKIFNRINLMIINTGR